MRPMCCVFSSPINFHVHAAVGRLVDAGARLDGVARVGLAGAGPHLLVSVGAMASMPIEMTRLSSKTGRQVCAVVRGLPDAAAAAATNMRLRRAGNARPRRTRGP